MNQLTLGYEQALEKEAARHVMYDALSVTPHLRQLLKFFDAAASQDGRIETADDLLITATTPEMLVACGYSGSSARAWKPIRDELRSCAFLELQERRTTAPVIKVFLRAIFDATSHGLVRPAIRAKAEELCRPAPSVEAIAIQTALVLRANRLGPARDGRGAGAMRSSAQGQTGPAQTGAQERAGARSSTPATQEQPSPRGGERGKGTHA